MDINQYIASTSFYEDKLKQSGYQQTLKYNFVNANSQDKRNPKIFI